ncbi:MAG: hypothetical protein R3C03_10555 [Pirellulaceae bacterium]
MMQRLLLAWQYISYYRWRSLILIGCITLTAFLPALLSILLTEFNERMLTRAQRTPLVLGAQGSGVDLTLHALYFSKAPKNELTYGEITKIRESGLGEAFPIYGRFTARDFPVVGTNLDYLEFRNAYLETGRTFAMLGECILGSDVAKQLSLGAGDKLLTDRENLVDIAGLYPLRLNIVGVMKPTGTADDRAVFVDIKTAWVIAGLGHGHEDLTQVHDDGKIASRDEQHIEARASVLPFIEINESNSGLVHFHGHPDEFPITAAIIRCPDSKSETLLLGRFESSTSGPQMLIPSQIIGDLLGLVFQVSQIFNASMALIGLSTLLLLGLVISLSLRLARREMNTMFRMGSSRGTIFQLQLFELAIVCAISAVLLVALIALTYTYAGTVLEQLVLKRN